ncbi:hypothetical protein MHYP_G00110700 [Metynnis hypsauchen]
MKSYLGWRLLQNPSADKSPGDHSLLFGWPASGFSRRWGGQVDGWLGYGGSDHRQLLVGSPTEGFQSAPVHPGHFSWPPADAPTRRLQEATVSYISGGSLPIRRWCSATGCNFPPLLFFSSLCLHAFPSFLLPTRSGECGCSAERHRHMHKQHVLLCL